MFKRYLFLSAMFFIYSFFGVFANAAGESVNNNTYISEEELTIYFRFDKDSIDGSYLSNTKTLKKLDDILSDESKAGKIESIRIFSTASPEGDFQYNQRLAKRRGIALSNYITENFKQINPDLISSSSQTESWEKVAYLISQDPNVKNKDSILYVLNENIPAREKERKLQSLDGGKSWQYVGRNYLRYLRTGTVCMIYYKDESPQKIGRASCRERVSPPV